MSNALLINFKSKASVAGARRDSLKVIADYLDITETAAAHIAINRLFLELFHRGAEYEFPTTKQIKWINDSLSTVKIPDKQTRAKLLEKPEHRA